MSSPFITPANGFPSQYGPPSPRPSSRAASAYEDPQDPSVQQMKLKVLYTFDVHNTKCLARWPRVLNVRTAYLDESTQIGIIDLKTCMQAIVAASPELVATLGQDYTVYAYDYSEYDVPLVGQGMLSWILASSSATPSAPTSQSRTFVTGLVCKSILGLFSGGPQETLEVKLRLVPVPTCLQSEYIESMNKYRELSKIMPEGFDARAWTEFAQANPGMFSTTDRSGVGSPACGSAPKDVGIEHVQRLFRESYASQLGQEQGQLSRRDSYSGVSTSGDPFRTASPAVSTHSNNVSSLRQPNPEQATSRELSQPNKQYIRSRKSSFDTGYASYDERQDGPAKKRAKVTKAEWPAKGSFGNQPDSLRVAASTAASVRVLQPTAIRPTVNTANSIEEPPRLPTPTPGAGNRLLRPALYPGRSTLGLASYSINDAEYQSPYAALDVNLKPASSTTTSPEDNRGHSISITPAQDIASSPPVFRDSTPSPSSPILPTLHRDYDSSFMSGPVENLLDDDEDRPLDDFDLEIAASYDRRTQIEQINSSTGVEQLVLTSRVVTGTECKEATASAPPPQEQAIQKNKPRVLSRTGSVGVLKSPPLAASDPVRPVSGMLQRSQTWSGLQFQHTASDAAGSEGSMAPKRVKSGSGVKRKAQLQNKLASAIAAGEMPPFCDNCGCIETPTWRKAWAKTHCGSSAGLQVSKSEGGICAIQTLEDQDGIVSLFKIFKKSLLETDVGFAEVLLCNPCGLWLHNRQCVRPRNLWKSRDQPDDNDKKGGKGKTKKGKNNGTAARSTSLSRESVPLGNGSSPVDEHGEDPRVSEGDELQLPPLAKQRAYSVQMTTAPHSRSEGTNEPSATTVPQRAIQSSPARLLGSQQAPIDLDGLTPHPTRRILFPSSNGPDESTTLPENKAKSDETAHGNSLDNCQSMHDGQQNDDDSDECHPKTANKENHPPNDDGLDDLFNEIPEQELRPSTPQPGSAAAQSGLPNPFKTPTQQPTSRNFMNTGDFFSSAAKAYLHGTATPTRTPSKLSPRQLNPGDEMTPGTFTRHLNEFLQDGFADSSPSKFIDFSSLPNLEESSSPSHYLDRNEFPFSDMLDADAPMPSSPPTWFGVYEDSSDSNNNFHGDIIDPSGNEEWMLNFGSSPLKAGLENADAKPAEINDSRNTILKDAA